MRKVNNLYGKVVPAQAGVILHVRGRRRTDQRRSRTSGGDPEENGHRNTKSESFPHKRG